MEENQARQEPDQKDPEWIDAIKENPLLFAALLVVFCIVVFLAGAAIYLFGVQTGSGARVSLPTTTLQFATSTPTDSDAATPAPPAGPSIDMLSVQGNSGTLITVTGQNWTPDDVVVVRIEDPGGSQSVQPLFANVQVTDTGSFIASFILPANSGWSNLTTIRITVESSTAQQSVSAEFSIETTPPTATVPPVDTPTPPPGSSPTPTTEYVSSPGDWLGEYYANPSLVGAPRLVRNATTIDFDWGNEAPGASLPADGFSGRWTRTFNLEPAIYRFHIQATDGVRLWVNDDLIIDEWFAGPQRETIMDYPVFFAGTHNIRIEYVNFAGPARIRFWWDALPLPPPPDPFPPYDYWHGEYWPNPDLFGSPSFVRKDSSINFTWGTNAPAPGMPNNNFSVRWTRLADFEPTNYRFYLTVNDGARVWVDNLLLIDEWQDGDTREVSKDLAMQPGPHEIRVEYYKRSGDGVVRVRWEKAAAATATPTPTATPIGYFPDWRGEYWSNINLSGNPITVRNDPQINFNWGLGSPDASIPPDNFSVRWSRSFPFENGTYRFTANIKDGIRFYVDGVLTLDQWRDVPSVQTYVVDLNLNGRHWLVVEYYHRTGEAVAGFNWQQIVATPSPTPSPTATLTPTPTGTATATATLSPSPTATPSPTTVPTSTATSIPSPTNTLVPTATGTPTLVLTNTPTTAPTGSLTPSPTLTSTSTITPTATQTN